MNLGEAIVMIIVLGVLVALLHMVVGVWRDG